MSPGARMEYLRAVHLRYKRAIRREKSIILNELCVLVTINVYNACKRLWCLPELISAILYRQQY